MPSLLKSRLARFFKRGLRALLPTVLTIGVLVIVYNFFAQYVVAPVNQGIEAFLLDTDPGNRLLESVFAIDVHAETYRIPATNPDYRVGRENIRWDQVRKDLDEKYPTIIGFLVALILVFVAGFFLASFVGRRVLSRFEAGMARFPVVKIIYPYARQVVEFLMRERTVKFHTVVAVPYPREGVYAIGFLTGLGFRKLNEATGDTCLNVFVPSSPTPITGWVIFVPAKDVIPLPITVDEAARFCISGGVIVPESQQNPETILDRFRNLQIPTIPSPADDEAEDDPQAPSTSV